MDVKDLEYSCCLEQEGERRRCLEVSGLVFKADANWKERPLPPTRRSG